MRDEVGFVLDPLNRRCLRPAIAEVIDEITKCSSTLYGQVRLLLEEVEEASLRNQLKHRLPRSRVRWTTATSMLDRTRAVFFGRLRNGTGGAMGTSAYEEHFTLPSQRLPRCPLRREPRRRPPVPVTVVGPCSSRSEFLLVRLLSGRAGSSAGLLQEEVNHLQVCLEITGAHEGKRRCVLFQRKPEQLSRGG